MAGMRRLREVGEDYLRPLFLFGIQVHSEGKREMRPVCPRFLESLSTATSVSNIS